MCVTSAVVSGATSSLRHSVVPVVFYTARGFVVCMKPIQNINVSSESTVELGVPLALLFGVVNILVYADYVLYLYSIYLKIPQIPPSMCVFLQTCISIHFTMFS